MPSSGRMEDGTPWMAIGADEPEAKELIVHTTCEECGEQHHFDFWRMFRGETIVCGHCGHESRAKRRVWTGDRWEDGDDR